MEIPLTDVEELTTTYLNILSEFPKFQPKTVSAAKQKAIDLLIDRNNSVDSIIGHIIGDRNNYALYARDKRLEGVAIKLRADVARMTNKPLFN